MKSIIFKSIRAFFFLLSMLSNTLNKILQFSMFCVPYLFFIISNNRDIIKKDIDRWRKELFLEAKNDFWDLFFLFEKFPEFRNLFYYRVESYSILIEWMFPSLESLHINTPKIGSGLFIQHGFSTIISAAEIGENCWINQQVTIGYSNPTDSPIIRNNVKIYSGAKVIGKVVIGNNVKIGANAVVIKDVPDNSTAVGIPAKNIFNHKG